MKLSQLFCLVLAAITCGGTLARGATVTVDPTGGGQYTTLVDAVVDFANWKDGTDNTIEFADGLHTYETRATFAALDGETVRLRPAAGAEPVIVPGPAAEECIRFEVGAMTAIIEGLVFAGSKTVGRSEANSAINVTSSSTVNLTIQNCVFTVNNGADVPVLDFLAHSAANGFPGNPFPEDHRLRHGLIIGSGAFFTVIQVTIKDCVMYGTNRDAIHVEASLIPGSSVVIEGSMFITCGEYSMHVFGMNEGVEFIVRGSVFNSNGFDGDSCIWLRGPSGLAPFMGTLSIEDSIIWKAGRGAIVLTDVGGTINVSDCTFWQEPGGGDMILQEQPDFPPAASFNLSRSIFRTGDSFIRFVQSSVGDFNQPGGFATLTGTHVAILGNTVRDGQHQSVKDAVAAFNGGDGPITIDPMFYTEIFTAAMSDGKRMWDSTENDLLDISNTDYLGLVNGLPLTGGAEFPINPAKDWVYFN